MSEEENKEYLENVEDTENYYKETYEDYEKKKDWEKNDREIEEGEKGLE